MHIEGLAELPRLLSLLASRTASLLNFADLYRGSAHFAAFPLAALWRAG